MISYIATTSRIFPVVETFNDKFNHLIAFLVLASLADFSFPNSSFKYTKILLKDGTNDRWINYLETFKKKDDLCDSFLQGYYCLLKKG